MKIIAILLIAIAPAIAAAQVNPDTLQAPPAARWLSIDQTSNGFVAGGNLDGTAWAFHVQGTQMKRLGERNSSTFSVDGAVIQLVPVPKSAIPGASASNALEAHRRFEQEHQRGKSPQGAEFVTQGFCQGAQFPHQEWTARLPSVKGPVMQAVVTFEVGNYVLMVVLPFENEARERVVARTIGDICATFRRQKV
jgi:hypothetical protein